MEDDLKNESSQETLDPERRSERGNVLSIVDRIAKRNAPEKIYLCRAAIKRDSDDEDEQH